MREMFTKSFLVRLIFPPKLRVLLHAEDRDLLDHPAVEGVEPAHHGSRPSYFYYWMWAL